MVGRWQRQNNRHKAMGSTEPLSAPCLGLLPASSSQHKLLELSIHREGGCGAWAQGGKGQGDAAQPCTRQEG